MSVDGLLSDPMNRDGGPDAPVHAQNAHHHPSRALAAGMAGRPRGRRPCPSPPRRAPGRHHRPRPPGTKAVRSNEAIGIRRDPPVRAPPRHRMCKPPFRELREARQSGWQPDSFDRTANSMSPRPVSRRDEDTMRTNTSDPLPPETGDDPAHPTAGLPGRSLGRISSSRTSPDPVFVSDLEGKILQANDAASSSWASGPTSWLSSRCRSSSASRRRGSSPPHCARWSPRG